MHSSPTQFGMALATLVVWLLLGAGNQAWAGIMLTPPSEPPALAFLVDDALHAVPGMPTGEVGQYSGMLERPSEERVPETPVPAHLCLVYHPLWNTGLGQSPGSCASTSGVSTVSVPGLHATLNAPVVPPPRAVVRRLSFADIQFQPPPFPSRLFRPPRSA